MPITCATCQRSNDPWRRHCGGCGGCLPGGCKACQFINRTDDKFCGGCAKPLRAKLPIKKLDIDMTTPIDIRDVLSESPT